MPSLRSGRLRADPLRNFAHSYTVPWETMRPPAALSALSLNGLIFISYRKFIFLVILLFTEAFIMKDIMHYDEPLHYDEPMHYYEPFFCSR